MRTSYHCHTVLSDGLFTITELVHAAIDAGLDELGISQHYVLLSNGGTVRWSMPIADLPSYFRELQAARREAGDKLVVRFGLEADFVPETAPELAEILKMYPFDYVIGSVHFVDNFPIDDSAGKWDALSENERNDMVRSYWSRIIGMAKSGLFDFAGHLDLYKKFGHRPTADVSADIAAALDAIAESGMAVELNTSGLHKMGEIYPSPAILRECYKRGIPTLVTTDAHHADHLLRSHEAGIAELKSIGYTQQAIFAERNMTLVDL